MCSNWSRDDWLDCVGLTREVIGQTIGNNLNSEYPIFCSLEEIVLYGSKVQFSWVKLHFHTISF